METWSDILLLAGITYFVFLTILMGVLIFKRIRADRSHEMFKRRLKQ